MALRLDNLDVDYLSRTTNLPSITSFTVMGWFRLRASQGAYTGLFSFGNSSGNNFYYFGGNGAITDEQIWNGISNNASGFNYVIDNWYHLALVVDGTGAGNARLYRDGALVVNAAGNASNPAQVMYIGEDPSLGDGANIAVSDLFVYDAALTLAEIKAQAFVKSPVRKSRLNGWYPFEKDTKDYSGLKNHWTENGALSYEIGPGYNKALTRKRVVLNSQTSGAISGSSSGTASSTATLTGAGALSGSSTGLASSVATLSIIGSSSGSGTSTANLSGSGALSGSAAGVATASATILGNGALSGSASGSASSQAYLQLWGSAAGSGGASGTLLGAGALNGSASGSGTASLATTQGALVASASGSASASGNITGSGALVSSSSGSGSCSGSMAGSGACSALISGASTVSGLITGIGALQGVSLGVASVLAVILGNGVLQGTANGSGSGTLDTGVPSELIGAFEDHSGILGEIEFISNKLGSIRFA